MWKLKEIEDKGIELGEDIGREIYCFSKCILVFFYKTTGLENIKKSYDAYSQRKIEITIEDINYEHKKLSKETLKDFYQNLDEQKLEYLYTIYEKSRTSTYRLTMKILARLSLNLIQNKTLNYYESSLLASIHLLTDEDFILLYEELEKNIGSNDNIRFEASKIYQLTIINKFLNIGILSQPDVMFVSQNDVAYRLNNYSKEFYEMLKEIKNSL